MIKSSTIQHVASAALLLAIASAPALAQGDAAAGQAKAAACIACHGADGNSTNPIWPKIAGQHAKYIAKQLADFKDGSARADATMAGMVAALSEQDMLDIAAFYAGQSRSGGFASEARAVAGEKLYRGGDPRRGLPSCTGCHGPAGAGDPLGGFPSLGGQHAAYTEKQLKDFRAGRRANDDSAMMREVVRWLTDDEIAALAEFVGALH